MPELSILIPCLNEAERLPALTAEVVALLRDLALAYHRQGKYDDAESCHRRALAISETIPGAERWVGGGDFEKVIPGEFSEIGIDKRSLMGCAGVPRQRWNYQRLDVQVERDIGRRAAR